MADLTRRIADLSPEQRALLERRLRQSVIPVGEPIAIIGMGCRFPGAANSPDAFWRLLVEGRDAVGPVPADRWDAEVVGSSDASGSETGLRWGGFLDRVDEFDPGFFGIAPREATQMDPQQRLLLEVAWEALEDAGQPAERLKGSATGVFVGIHSQSSDYFWLQVRDRATIDTYTASGTAHSIVANRLSYLLDLRGPSVSLDTACSSSLVAVHLACQSLRSGDCDMALAAGVNLMLSPEAGLSFAKLQMLAPDGRCKTFDASANGFGRGEGCGLVVLKRLKDAIRDGDPILALIRGTAVNQDGSTNGLTAPNGLAQQSVVRRALAVGGVEPDTMSYVETHGTGTALGDPIEVEALTTVVGAPRPGGRPCVLGSVKANIGHLEAAAGIAGLIKVVLCLQREAIPAQPHFRTLNPHISLAGTAFAIPTTLTPWRRGDGARIAGVSSFGFGGTNAHAVLEEAPATSHAAGSPVVTARPSVGAPILLPISARSAGALRDLANAYQERLGSGEYGTPEAFRDLCYSAAVRRSHHDHRLAVAGCDARDCAARLRSFVADETSSQVAYGRVESELHSGPVFVFSGQGPQWSGMGRELLEAEPVFRDVIERCDALVRAAAGWSLLQELQAPEAACRLAETEVAQPALFALQVALAAMWRAWGIEPSAVVGHSLGEVAAAHVAGALSLEEAIRVVVHRGQIMQRATGQGKMAAVELSAEEAERTIAGSEDRLAIAAVNAPTSIVLSGEYASLEAVLAELKARNVRCQPLPVNYAFHSPQMEPLAVDLVRALAGLTSRPCTIPLISTVTGRSVEAAQLDAAHWGRNIRQPVRFADAIGQLVAQGHDGFVEISPHPVLSGAIAACLASHGRTGVVAASMRRKQAERLTALSALGVLYTHGYPLDWRRLYPTGGRCVALPAYPWQRARHWLARTPANVALPGGPSAERGGRRSRDTRLGRRLSSAIPTFQNRLNPDDFPLLRHHQIHGASVLPLTVILEMALAAAQEALGADACALEDVTIHRALVWDPAEDRMLQLALGPRQGDAVTFQLFSRGDGGGDDDPFAWTLHVIGKVRFGAGAEMSQVRRPTTATPEQVRARCRHEVAGADLDAVMRTQGIECVVPGVGIETIWRGEGEALGRIRLRRELASSGGLRSSVLLAAFQLVFAVTPEQAGGDDGVGPLVPVGLQSFHAAEAGEAAWAYARWRSNSESRSSGMIDLELWDASGGLVAQALGVRLAPLASHALGVARKAPWQDWLYEIAWQPAERRDGRRAAGEPPPLGVVARRVEDAATAGRDAEVSLAPLAASLERLSILYAVVALRQLGWRLRPGESVAVHDLSQRLAILPRHHRLFGRICDMLQDEGVLCRVGSNWEVRVAPPEEDPQAVWSALADAYPTCLAELRLLAQCGGRLGDVLRGACDPLSLLFPGGSLATLEAVYQRSPILQPGNTQVGDAVAMLAKSVVHSGPLRILEIGAGTGATTQAVLSRLQLTIAQYVFTDLSPVFLRWGREKCAGHSSVEFTILDIERDPLGQGFKPEEFDLVIAANVLHATRDLRESLAHIRTLLRPEGVLVLLEVTGRHRWIDLIFGLMEGWWRFSDGRCDVGYPLLSRSGWPALLREAGFPEVEVIPVNHPGTPTAAEQSVVLARARQLHPPSVHGNREGGRWVILADECGIGQRLATLLSTGATSCVTVRPGDQYARIGEREYCLDGKRPEDFARLFAEFAGRGIEIRGIVHLWSLVAKPGVNAEAATQDMGSAPRHECRSLLSLIQAVASGACQPAPRIWVVTQGAQAVGVTDRPSALGQSTLWGLGRVAAVEHPEIWGGLLDLEDGDPDVCAARLWEELTEPDGESQLAVRRGRRHVARLRRVTLQSSSDSNTGCWLRAEGTYLITGGLGGIGLAVARRMALRGAKHLVLVGRRPPFGAAIEQIAKLQETGAAVLALQTDVSRREDVARMFSSLRQSLPPLRGIIHAAGIYDDRVLLRHTWDRFERVFASKVSGAWNLHLVSADLPLDHFVLFSSIAAPLGMAGLANYSAANAYLGLLAHYRQAAGLPALCIDWGAWERLGMAEAVGDEREGQWRAAGLTPMQPDEALDAFEALVSAPGLRQIGVQSVDWSRFLEPFEGGKLPSIFREVVEASVPMERDRAGSRDGVDLRNRLASVGPSERQETLQVYVRDQVLKVLGANPGWPLEQGMRFFDAGMDSLTAVELKNRLQAAFERPLSATLVFDYPTVAALSRHLATEVLGWPPVRDTREGSHPSATTSVPVDDDEKQSEDELTNLLAARLKRMQGGPSGKDEGR